MTPMHLALAERAHRFMWANIAHPPFSLAGWGSETTGYLILPDGRIAQPPGAGT